MALGSLASCSPGHHLNESLLIEPFAKFATGQVILPANVMFCLFQYRVRPGEKCEFTTKSTKITKRIFRNPSRDAGCEDIHAGRRPSAGSDHTKPACLGRFSSFRSFCVFVPFVAIPGKDPAAAFCKRLNHEKTCDPQCRAGIPPPHQPSPVGSGPPGSAGVSPAQDLARRKRTP